MKTNAIPIVLFWLALTTIGQSQPPDGANDEPGTKALVVSEEVRETLVPLFSSIATADTSRATVELTAQSTLTGEVVNQQESTYQIASRRPDRFTIYLKEPNQRTRIYGSEESLTIVMSPRAYVQLPEPISIQDAAISLPVPLGPYPEPVLALTNLRNPRNLNHCGYWLT